MRRPSFLMLVAVASFLFVYGTKDVGAWAPYLPIPYVVEVSRNGPRVVTHEAKMYTVGAAGGPLPRLPKKDVNYAEAGGASASARPQEVTRTIEFTTTEGTWMTVDVSPDGKTIIFDLLGQLYSLPVEGGVARPLAHHEWAWDANPRFSSDGREVAFISDRKGKRELWILNLQTHVIRNLPTRTNLLAHIFSADTPRWLPGNREIAASTSNDPSAARIQVFNVQTGAYRWLIGDGGEASEGMRSASFSSDGKVAYTSISRDATAGRNPAWTGRKTVEDRLYRLDLSNGEATPLNGTDAGYDEYKPELSHSGRRLAYVRNYSVDRTELRIKDLEHRTDVKLMTLVGADQPNRYSSDDEFPGYAFTPDDRYIVVWSGGRLCRVSVSDGTVETIPFKVNVNRAVSSPLQANFSLDDDFVNVRALGWPSLSNNDTFVFAAAGSIWMRKLPSGEPERLTTTQEFGVMPALSPNGQRIAYVSIPHSRSEVSGNRGIRVVNLVDRSVTDLTSDDANYSIPQWSPDGTRLGVERQLGHDSTLTSEVGWIDLGTRVFHHVAGVVPYRGGMLFSVAYDDTSPKGYLRNLSWSLDGENLLLQSPSPVSSGSRDRLVVQYPLDGSAERVIAKAEPNFVYGVIPSPDLKRVVLLGHDQQLYVTDMPDIAKGPALFSLDMPGLRRITELGATYVHWQTSDRLVFGFMDRLYSFRFGETHPHEIAETHLRFPRRPGKSVFAIRNARLITVANGKDAGPVVEHGTIVVRDRRIQSLGTDMDVAVPRDAKVYDGAGLTIMPGIVDVHYHELGRGGLNLDRAIAYGVTTSLDPGGGPSKDRSAALQELIEIGALRGPRFFFDNGATYTVVIRTSSNESVEKQIREAIRRKREQGVGPCLKIIWAYTGGNNRIYERMLADAAREEKLCVVGHIDDRPMTFSYVIDGVSPHHSPGITDPQRH